MDNTQFNPQGNDNTAATEFCKERNEFLKGIVHDENARYFGGISGHAGVFSNLMDLSKYCRMYLNCGKNYSGELFFSTTTIDCIVNNYTMGLQESRGLGFCVKAQEISSGGELLTKDSFGHTGFTGTSLWIDRKRGIYVTLLTNRVHPTRENNKIIKFRRHFHNAVNYAVDQYLTMNLYKKSHEG